MRCWLRPLLLILLVLAIPVQGWAAARMSLQMAAAHLDASAMPHGSTHDMASMGDAAPGLDPVHHACCPEEDGAFGPDGSGTGHCAESCHCCLVAALPQPLGDPAPVAVCQRALPHVAEPLTGGDSATPDKPPKS
jgi:hypothetical protein